MTFVRNQIKRHVSPAILEIQKYLRARDSPSSICWRSIPRLRIKTHQLRHVANYSGNSSSSSSSSLFSEPFFRLLTILLSCLRACTAAAKLHNVRMAYESDAGKNLHGWFTWLNSRPSVYYRYVILKRNQLVDNYVIITLVSVTPRVCIANGEPIVRWRKIDFHESWFKSSDKHLRLGELMRNYLCLLIRNRSRSSAFREKAERWIFPSIRKTHLIRGE